MTNREKTEYALDFYSDHFDKKGYCIDLHFFLKKRGFERVWTSIQNNWFNKGIFPSNKKLINLIYEFTKQYKKKIAAAEIGVG
ncbi:hypothetical protein J0X14_14405 [Muricauda sp. CAU 1633]|uniref:hypothetical protein n=1 Tax=Allomuricauda sp. CAU 1633 TaxID=2816036 RepID=UPI001A8EC870|nr:hypothetical protein [Muricauda sp. CAU 1633]MBO0323497.1 hypothetical protein [Muricauda sp. CAU 1633]